MSSPAMNSPGMSKRMTRWLLALYPRAWRDRYGAEVTSLTEELIRAGETTPLPAGLNLVAGAAVERARALAASRTALTLSSAAVIVALVGGAFTLTGGARPTSGPRGLASANCLMEPALRLSVSAAGIGRPQSPVSRPQLKSPRRPGRWLAAPVASRPSVTIVRLGQGGRILRLAGPGGKAGPVMTLAVRPGRARVADRKLIMLVRRRLALSARTTPASIAKSRLAEAAAPPGSRTAATQPVQPVEPAWAGPLVRSCQQVTAVPNPVSGRTQKLRGVPPVPVATRTTR